LKDRDPLIDTVRAYPPDEPPAGNGIQLAHGVIIASCNEGCSTYRVQRVRRRLLSDCEDCGSGSGSGSEG
jgi:hypothetical protein